CRRAASSRSSTKIRGSPRPTRATANPPDHAAMLAALSIRDIVLIDKLDLEFGSGLSALTGETGAGKSILLDALALALGGRGDASLVRNGQDSGQVVAVLQLPVDHPVRVALRENEIADDADLIMRRVQYADG